MLIPSLDTQFRTIDNISRYDIYYDIVWRMPNVKFIDVFMKLTFIHSIIERSIQRIDDKINSDFRYITITVKINLVEFFYEKNQNLINAFVQHLLRIDWIFHFHFLIQFTFYEINKQNLNNKCIWCVIICVISSLTTPLPLDVVFFFSPMGLNIWLLFLLENSIDWHINYVKAIDVMRHNGVDCVFLHLNTELFWLFWSHFFWSQISATCKQKIPISMTLGFFFSLSSLHNNI